MGKEGVSRASAARTPFFFFNMQVKQKAPMSLRKSAVACKDEKGEVRISFLCREVSISERSCLVMDVHVSDGPGLVSAMLLG